jgi:hypothetical protein
MHMKKALFLLLALLLTGASATSLQAHAPYTVDNSELLGRWDLTLYDGNKEMPSWLEVKLSGIRTLVGYFVGESGSARPISQVFFNDGKVSFSIPAQWDDTDKPLTLEGTLRDGMLSGTITTPKGEAHRFVGVRAPSLKRSKPVEWGEPVQIFNGKNLDGWRTQTSDNQWVVEGGVLKSPRSGSNIMTAQKFEDFKLHIEFRYPKGSNSGVYLRGRYEVQVEDDAGKEPSSTYFGGVYGFLTPNEMAAGQPGEWQTYDITLVGRTVSVVANGKTIICEQVIPGITGGALDSREGEPGPILLQGDHGPVEYRNIVITPAK